MVLKNYLFTGNIPKSKYGNYELLWGDPPEGTKHIKLEDAQKVCKKLKIEYLDVITGFDTNNKGGRILPIKEGIIIYEKDEKILLDSYEEQLEKIKADKQKRMK